MKEEAYKGMVRPILEYGSSVWDPHPDKLQKELERVQNRAASFVTRNYDYETGSMTGILGQLKWESLKKRRKDNRLILLYKGLKGKAEAIRTTVVPIRILIRTTVVPITPLIDTTIVRIRILIGTTGI